MSIKEINELHVKKTIEEPDRTPKIIVENIRTKNQVEVLGKILEAQYGIGEDILLLVTEGNPFEEALYIYYFNSELQIKDSLELSAMYAEGMLRNISIIEPNRVSFSFFDNSEQWLLEILPNPKLSILNNKYPVKRHLSAFHKSWLKLKKS